MLYVKYDKVTWHGIMEKTHYFLLAALDRQKSSALFSFRIFKAFLSLRYRMHSSQVVVTCCRSTPATAAAASAATTAGERRRANQRTLSGSTGSTLPTGTSSIPIRVKLSVFAHWVHFGAFLHRFHLNFLMRFRFQPLSISFLALTQQRIFIFGTVRQLVFFHFHRFLHYNKSEPDYSPRSGSQHKEEPRLSSFLSCSGSIRPRQGVAQSSSQLHRPVPRTVL